MLELIIANLYSKVAGRFDRFHPLVELLPVGEDKVAPKEYIGSGQYNVIDFDNFAGVGYIRRNGETSFSPSDLKSSCKLYYDVTYPLTLVGCIKKDVLGKDDPYSSDSLALTLFQDMDKSGILAALKAVRVDVNVKNYNSDMPSILSKEYSGVENLKKGIPYDYCLISIDLEVVCTVTKDCLQIYCNSYCNYSPVLGDFSGTNFGTRARQLTTFTIPAIEGVYSYTDSRLHGKTISLVFVNSLRLLNDIPGESDQYSHLNSTFTILDTSTGIRTGDKITFIVS